MLDELTEKTDTEKHNFTIHLNEYEGPLDLLLELSRKKKFDLSQISIADLAKQYILFIQNAQKLRIEIAADYLVMAAYLAWLKSRLLLPDETLQEDNFSPEDHAKMLHQRLLHLEEIKNRGAALFKRNRLGQNIFAYGQATEISIREKPIYQTKLYQLLKSYATIKMRGETGTLTITATRLFNPEQMQERLKLLIGDIADWTEIAEFMPVCTDKPAKKSALASLIVGGLSMVKAGIIDMQQASAFAPIYIKKHPNPLKP